MAILLDWTFVVENKLNEMNYVVKRGRGKSNVIHFDRMCKLPNELDLENSDCQENDMRPTSQPKLRRKASNAAMETNTHCAVCKDCELQARIVTRHCFYPWTTLSITRLIRACQSALTFAIRQWLRAKVQMEH